jgi:prepilin-type N-terminal cleavage/methylation domain-containing protein
MPSKNQKGFSLIELAVVVTIAGLVLAIVTPSINRYLLNAKLRDAASRFTGEMRLARQRAVANNGRYWFWTYPGVNYYWIGEQRWIGGNANLAASYSNVTWKGPYSLASNVRVLNPNWGGYNYFIYWANGRPMTPANTATSGSVKLVTVQGVPDTITVNVDLSGAVWK